MIESMFTYIEGFLPLPEENRQQCRAYFQPAVFPKHTVIQAAGTVPAYHNFVVSGLLRNYFINEKGEEVTTDLNEGPRFFTSYQHFMARTPSPETIVCLSDCELLRIDRAGVDALMAVGGEVIREFTMLLMQQSWQKEKERLQDRSTLSAKQRYLKFARQHPQLMQQVPLQYIASYLGIKPESLSRIRRKLNASS